MVEVNTDMPKEEIHEKQSIYDFLIEDHRCVEGVTLMRVCSMRDTKAWLEKDVCKKRKQFRRNNTFSNGE